MSIKDYNPKLNFYWVHDKFPLYNIKQTLGMYIVED